MAPHATQTREHILELCELHLKPSLARARVLAKDVEDECRAVDDLGWLLERTLQIGLL